MSHVAVERLVLGEIGVNCYIVENTKNQECFVVDPGAEADRIFARIGNRKPVAVLLTHGHFDHIGAVDELCSHYGIPVYVHEADAPKLLDAQTNVSALFGMPLVQTTQPSVLSGDETLSLAGMEVQVMHTPGHTSGCVCYRLPNDEGILTGDTLFAHGYGRTDLPDGDLHALYASLRRLMKLTPRMITYPGHEAFGVVGRDPAEVKE